MLLCDHLRLHDDVRFQARARRILDRAALTCVVVLLALFFLRPLIHQIGHRANHVHLPNGDVVYTALSPTDPPPSKVAASAGAATSLLIP